MATDALLKLMANLIPSRRAFVRILGSYSGRGMDQDAKRYGSGNGPLVAPVCRAYQQGSGVLGTF